MQKLWSPWLRYCLFAKTTLGMLEMTRTTYLIWLALVAVWHNAMPVDTARGLNRGYLTRIDNLAVSSPREKGQAHLSKANQRKLREVCPILIIC